MPDANKNQTLNQLVGAAFGAAGQRCMALSTAVFVGQTKEWIPEFVEMAKQLKVNQGMQPDADLGPMISPQVDSFFLLLISISFHSNMNCFDDYLDNYLRPKSVPKTSSNPESIRVPSLFLTEEE